MIEWLFTSQFPIGCVLGALIGGASFYWLINDPEEENLPPLRNWKGKMYDKIYKSGQK